MRLRELLPPRLALNISLVGLAQMVVVAAGFWAILEATRPSPLGPLEQVARRAATEVEPYTSDATTLREKLRGVAGERADITVIDPVGTVVASTADDSPRCSDRPRPGRMPPPSDRIRLPIGLGPPTGPPPGTPAPPGAGAAGLPRHPGHCAIVALALPGGDGQLHYLASPPPPPPSLGTRIVALVLLVVGISSMLLAWSLVRPLRRLSAAARSFGAGDMTARAGVNRKDELGEVSRAFDDMAERVTQLLRAEKELIANVSHELRTPLARIRVAVDLATEGDAEVARDALVDIAADLNELERLISDVLTAARLDLATGAPSSGIPPLRIERVDTSELVAQSVSRFEIAHPDRQLRIDVEEGAPELDGDPVLLRRVVDNLLENAHKYTEDTAAPIVLTARYDGGSVIIEVADRGIGISATDLAHVFRPFFRADKSRTRATGGLGLGLALAKRIVDAHGGSLVLESTPGSGTLARITLPAAPSLEP